jgi:hypothetical protein
MSMACRQISGRKHDAGAFVEVGPAAFAHGGAAVGFLGGGAGLVRDFERQVVDADAAFDFEPIVAAGDVEVMGGVLEEILELREPCGGQDADEGGDGFLEWEGAGFQMKFVGAVRDRAAIMKDGAMEDGELHVVGRIGTLNVEP